MILYEDTRQKEGKHNLKHEYWEKEGITVERKALSVGDYMLPDGDISVDTKQDIVEICQNMLGAWNQDRRRFTAEVMRARDEGCRLVFLIEDRRYRDIPDLYGEKIWVHSGRIKMGDQLATSMYTMHARYGCEFRFCKPEDAGRIVMEILENEHT